MAKLLKVLWWIFGMALAWGIDVGLLTFLVYHGDWLRVFHNYYLYVSLTLIEITYVFGLPVLLSAAFVPRPKKYGALISASTIAMFLLASAIYQIYEAIHKTYRIQGVTLFTYAAAFSGLVLALTLSHFIFQNRGWHAKPKKPSLQSETEILETY